MDHCFGGATPSRYTAVTGKDSGSLETEQKGTEEPLFPLDSFSPHTDAFLSCLPVSFIIRKNTLLEPAESLASSALVPRLVLNTHSHYSLKPPSCSTRTLQRSLSLDLRHRCPPAVGAMLDHTAAQATPTTTALHLNRAAMTGLASTQDRSAPTAATTSLDSAAATPPTSVMS